MFTLLAASVAHHSSYSHGFDIAPTFICRNSEKRIVDIVSLSLSPVRIKKVGRLFFSINEEKVFVSRQRRQSEGIVIYNIGAIVKAKYEKMTLLLHGNMKGNPYIFWNIVDEFGQNRAGLFKIKGGKMDFYCSSDA